MPTSSESAVPSAQSEPEAEEQSVSADIAATASHHTGPASFTPTARIQTDAGSAESAASVAAATTDTAEEPATTDPAEDTATTDRSEEPAATKLAAKAAKPKPMTLDDVTSVGSFLRLLAQHKTGPKALTLKTGSVARTLFAKPIDFDPHDDEIHSHVAEDPRLNTPVSLLLTVDKSDLTGGARQNFLSLATRLIVAHPAFQDEEIADSLRRAIAADHMGEPARPLIDSLIERARNASARAEAMKPNDHQALVDNAATFAILLAAMVEKWSVAALVDAFADNVWLTGVPNSHPAQETLATLSKSVRPGLALVVIELRQEVTRLRSAANDAAERADWLLERNDQLTDVVTETQRERDAAISTLQRLQENMDRTAEAHRADRMQSANEYEALRVSMSRVVTTAVEALEDALDALKHGHADVTVEYVGRAAASMGKSLNQLQPRNRDNSQGGSQ